MIELDAKIEKLKAQRDVVWQTRWVLDLYPYNREDLVKELDDILNHTDRKIELLTLEKIANLISDDRVNEENKEDILRSMREAIRTFEGAD